MSVSSQISDHNYNKKNGVNYNHKMVPFCDKDIQHCIICIEGFYEQET